MCHLVSPVGSVIMDITASSHINNGLMIQMLIYRVAGGHFAHWEKHGGFPALIPPLSNSNTSVYLCFDLGLSQ